MKFELEIETDNAAFEDDPCEEVSRILRELADRMHNTNSLDHPTTLRDINGNKVGVARFTGGEENG